MSEAAQLFQLIRHNDVTGVSGTGVVADGVLWPDGTVTIRWRGERRSTIVWSSIDDVKAIHGHGGATTITWLTQPAPDLSRLPEMTGYLQQMAGETGDDAPLEFWSEIRRSINAPIRAWIKDIGGDPA
jgi:hypothetical protein